MRPVESTGYYSYLAERVYRAHQERLTPAFPPAKLNPVYERLRALLKDRLPEDAAEGQLATEFRRDPELAANVAELLDGSDLDAASKSPGASPADRPCIAQLAEHLLIALESRRKEAERTAIIKVLTKWQIALPSRGRSEYQKDPSLFRWWLRRDLREGLSRQPQVASDIWQDLDWPRPFSLVLKEELEEIEISRQARGCAAAATPKEDAAGADPIQAASHMELIGLAFSGGGIRSATFNLGVLQALAKRDILRGVDYLSTVSGGGYIAAFLVSWIRNLRGRAPAEQVQGHLSPDGKAGKTQQPIEFLRRYSNYLTPELGVFSADTWTMLAIWLRNTILNLAILIAGFASLLIVPRLIALLYAHEVGPFDWVKIRGGLQIALLALLAIATFFIGRNLRAIARKDPEKWYTQRQWIQVLVVFPVVLGTLLLSQWLHDDPEFFGRLSHEAVPGASQALHDHPLQPWYIVVRRAAPWFFLLFFMIQTCAGFFGCYLQQHCKARWVGLRALAAMLLIPLACAVASSFMLHGLAQLFHGWEHQAGGPFHAVTAGPPLVVLLFSLGVTLQIGLMGRDLPDAAREWLSRVGAWLAIASLAWLGFFGVSLYGPYAIAAAGAWAQGGAFATWLLTTVAGVLAGKSAATRGAQQEAKAPLAGRAVDWFARATPYVFVIGFLLLVALGVHVLLRPVAEASHSAWVVEVPVDLTPPSGFAALKTNYWSDLRDAQLLFARDLDVAWWQTLEGLLLAAGLFAFLLSCRVDVNEFSLHHFYKNRLVRAFLGATRAEERNPSPFTGFDENDDQALKNFRHDKYQGPFPIINATLNLNRGRELAWQERRASSFSFTPLYCGFDLAQPRASDCRADPDLWPSAYRRTENYAYPATGADTGVHLGTAIAISGAAASPNMGYHTSTPLAFLMTILDVRLGWWLGNPRRQEKSRKSGPTLGLIYLLKELLGLTDDRAGFVYISDGGHFENLGIYELVRRRCRYIIACDAEQDGEMKFGGLAGAIRKCRTDFGVEIRVELDRLHKVNGLSRAHCAVGTIRYPECSDPGILLYLKASLTGDEPSDVQEYHAQHSDFPHQSTGDQWFDESQFESYRRLGLHVAETAFGSVRTALAPNLKQCFFGELKANWYPPSSAIEQSGSKHSQAYSDLMEKLRQDPGLKFLDPQVFADWPAQPGWADEDLHRRVRYICNNMIELMQSVYLDLNLESELEREHPHNQGWIKIFKQWVSQPAFQQTWEITGRTYGARFKSFYERLVEEAKHKPAEERYGG